LQPVMAARLLSNALKHLAPRPTMAAGARKSGL